MILRTRVAIALGAVVCCGWGARLAAAETLKSGIDMKGFDKSVDPVDDLYMHVNGEWLRRTPIPSDKSNYGSFSILMDEALVNLRTLIEQAAEGDHAKGSDEQKVGDFYRSFMNEELAEEKGLKPLAAELEKLGELESVADVVRKMGTLQHLGLRTPMGYFVDQDDRDSTRYLPAFVQSGTSLPDRDYYLEDDEKYLKARAALTAYITRLFTIAQLPDPEAAAKSILEIETKLARIQWERTELRNAEKRYNKFELATLEQQMPEIPWRSFLAEAGTPDPAEVNVMTPSFFEGLQSILKETSPEAWVQYLRFMLIDAYAPFLGKEIVTAHFEFHDQELGGVPEQQPRWKRAVEATSGAGAGSFGVLGDVVGRLYVAEHFKPEAKARMDQLVENLMKAYESSIKNLSWMTPTTKQRALEKLSKIRPKIGYTEKWRDYADLQIDADDLVGNVMRSNRVEHKRMTDKLGKPVDRTEWGMTPQTVNAYYNPGMNEIVFPAAILQPPFFDATAEDAVNYGGIGAVIGHEISHGFDDQGSKYDGDGNLENWWSDKDRNAFKSLTQRLVSQFADYEPLPGKKLNGELTLGENIADLSGMSIALKAYRLSLGGNPAPVLQDWTGDQRFFIGWAQIWRRNYRDAEMVRRLLTDPHSPSHYRANGPLTNLDSFYDAFGVKEGDKLYKSPEDRIRIW